MSREIGESEPASWVVAVNAAFEIAAQLRQYRMSQLACQSDSLWYMGNAVHHR